MRNVNSTMVLIWAIFCLIRFGDLTPKQDIMLWLIAIASVVVTTLNGIVFITKITRK